MRIDGLGIPQQPDPKDKKTKSVDKSDNIEKSTASNPDLIDLSSPKTKTESVGYAEKIREAFLADKNQSKHLTSVKHKVVSGFYDTAKARESISDKLIDSEDLKPVIRQFHSARANGSAKTEKMEAHDAKITRIREKVAEGFYNNPDNFQTFADKIMAYFSL